MTMDRRQFMLGATALGAALTVMPFEAFSAGGPRTDRYQVLCFKYAGPVASSGALLMYMKDWAATVQRNFYFWALRSKDEVVVVDCGVRPAFAAERKLAGYVSPETLLARVGIAAAEVRHLVLTHAHFDHIGCLALFPNATVYMQRREFDFWIRDPMAKRPPFAALADPVALAQLAQLEGTGRLKLVDGDKEILPGVELLLTPGHTQGLQSVAVSAQKELVVLASDSAHVRRNFELDTPSSLITDLPAMLASFTKLRQKVGNDLSRLFPGHDVKLLEDYPLEAPDITRLA